MSEASGGRERIGVFGSAFNPPQFAHLRVVEDARRQLALDRVVIVPTGEPYHKSSGSDPGRELRFRMAEAAFADVEATTISRAEVDRPGPSFSYVTLEQIAESSPTGEIVLLMGADAARSFSDWSHPERILELARIAVFPRPGVDREEVRQVFEGLDGLGQLEFLDFEEAGVSSSEVRQRIGSGLSIEDLVPQSVVEIINNEGVYGSEL